VRKLCACRGDAHSLSARESADTKTRAASVRFSLCKQVIRCLLANAPANAVTTFCKVFMHVAALLADIIIRVYAVNDPTPILSIICMNTTSDKVALCECQ